MRKSLLALMFISLSVSAIAQKKEMNCFERLEAAFKERGAYTIADDMHRNVIISFFEDGNVSCVNGKVRVENGKISSIFLQFSDATFELMDIKFYNSQKQPPAINNGISELILTQDGQKLRVVFIEKLKPKKKQFQEATLPDDL
jgi:hypothetical protein